MGFQGPPTRNVILQTVQKCTFPVHSNRTLWLEIFAPPLSLCFFSTLDKCSRWWQTYLSAPAGASKHQFRDYSSLIPIVLHVSNV